MNYHYEKKNYQRVIDISEKILICGNDYDAILASARSDHYLGKHDEAIAMFKKVSVSANADRLLLAQSYAASGRKEQALEIVKTLSGDQKIYSEAKKDKLLGQWIKEMEKAAEQKMKEQSTRLNQPPRLQ